MMSCKDVSTLVSTGNLETARLARRIGVHLHLMMCRHCRTFRRQLLMIGRAARLVSAGFEAEPSPDFEDRIVMRLQS